MAIQIYNFKKYDGYAFSKDFDNERWELLVYLKRNSNTLCTMCAYDKVEETYNLYNFITDKEHLLNMKKAGVNWFDDLHQITLFVDKITPDTKLFIEFALHCNCEVKLIRR